MRTRLRRLPSVLAALLVVAGAQVVTQLAVDDAANAVPGRVRVVSPATATDTTPTKSAFANCPSGTRVVGGGGWAFDNDAGKVHFTRLEPFHVASLDTYAVEAASEPGFTGAWWLQAYAICAPAPAGIQIVTSAPTASTSSTFVSQTVDCPGNKQLLGTGAKILNGGREVGLQRNGGTSLTRVLSTAREDANGYSGNWTLTVYGVCANTVPGANLAVTQTNGTVSFATCTTGTVHSVGGGGPFFDAGPVFLNVLFPSSNASKAEVAMSGTPSHGITEADAYCIP